MDSPQQPEQQQPSDPQQSPAPYPQQNDPGAAVYTQQGQPWQQQGWAPPGHPAQPWQVSAGQQPGWGPQQGRPGVAPDSMWWPTAPYGGTPTPPAPASPPGAGHRGHPHRSIPALVAAALVVAAAAGGVGIGHVVWPGTQSASSGPVALSSGSRGTGTSSGSSSSSSSSGSSGASAPGSSANSAPDNSASGGSAPNESVPGGSAPGESGPYGGGTGNGGTGSGGGTGNGGDQNQAPRGNDGGGTAQPPSLLPGGLIPGGLIPGGLLPGNQIQGGESDSSGVITSAPGAPDNISGILNKVDGALVDINDTFAYQNAAGAGTGIVLTASGEVITNNHVIDGATSISVTDIGNGKTYGATVVGYDPSDDIAVLQLKHASGLQTATIGNSSTVKKGEPVVGIGNAGGVGGTPSAAGGSVTALNRSISVGDEMYGTTEHLKGLIEVNADIRSGDSGGPLVTKTGTVVGIDTAASSGGARTAGDSSGFAIPINRAMSIAKTIESGAGTSTIHVGPTAALGVLISTSGQSQSNAQLPGQSSAAPEQQTKGALVVGVIESGAVADTNLQAGDVITSLDGHHVTSSQELSSLMLRYHPGQSVTLGWTAQNGTAHTTKITLGTGPAA